MITKDGRDTPIERLTPEIYIVPKGEEKSYHAVIEVKQFDPKTGVRISRPRIQKFGKKSFESHVRESLRKQGYDILILHDPNAWIKDQQAKVAERAKADAEAKAKAEKEKFDAAVAEAVAKALAVERKKAQKDAEKAEKDADGADAQPATETPAKGRKKAKEQEQTND